MTWIVRRHAPVSQGGCTEWSRTDAGVNLLNHVTDRPSQVTCPTCLALTQLPIGATQ